MKRLLILSLALLLLPSPVSSQSPHRPEGSFDNVDYYTGAASGWAFDPGRPGASIRVVIVVDGADVAQVDANVPRPDVNTALGVTGNHGFAYVLPDRLRDGKAHTVEAFALASDGKTRVTLDASPKSLALAPPGTSPPAPALASVRVPAGQPLPVRRWVERLVPPGSTTEGGTPQPASGIGSIGAAKHQRVFYHPGLKKMVYAGGDSSISMKTPENTANGTGSEIRTLDVLNDKWELLRPLCVPGEVQPGRPDNVVWGYHKRTNRGLMAPGFYFSTQGLTSGCGAKEGWGGYAFSFDTLKFIGPDDPTIVVPPPTTPEFRGGGWGGDDVGLFGVVDNVGDELLRVANQRGLQRLNLRTITWRVQALNTGNPHRSQQVIDEVGRALYLVQPWGNDSRRTPHLLKIFLNRSGDYPQQAIPLPPQWKPPGGTDHEVYLAFDPGNRVLFVPNNPDMGGSALYGLGIYHVDTGEWEWEAVPGNVTGSVWGFDENSGVLVGVGKRSTPYAYYLYKYGPKAPNAVPAPRRGP